MSNGHINGYRNFFFSCTHSLSPLAHFFVWHLGIKRLRASADHSVILSYFAMIFHGISCCANHLMIFLPWSIHILSIILLWYDTNMLLLLSKFIKRNEFLIQYINVRIIKHNNLNSSWPHGAAVAPPSYCCSKRNEHINSRQFHGSHASECGWPRNLNKHRKNSKTRIINTHTHTHTQIILLSYNI